MKRTEALAEIKWCGYHGDTVKAGEIAAKKGIGTAALRKAFQDGKKAKRWNEPCGCAQCAKKRDR
jgi:hypothetical protein